tara:strand:+ start:1424 stop:3421 length:1998 start_codon:yes stop_codon:yes gene_type:complete
MKYKTLLIIFSSILAFSNNDKKLVEVNFNDIKDLDILVRMDIDLDHHRTLESVHAHVNENQFNTISELGFDIKYIPNQARLYYEELIADPTYSDDPMRSYHNYNELTDFLININSEFPTITNLFSIGQSVQGRELWVLEISDNPGINEIEPEFKYIANMHGDETVGRELCLYLISWFVNGYGSDERATDLINDTSIFIMPSMNPDGFENGSRYNANNVDLNRDFPDQFNDPNNSLTGRQPETQAVMEWTWQRNFVLSANMHTGALVVNYPFDGPNTGVYSGAPDDDVFVQISRCYADSHPNMESGGFQNGITNGAQWYAVFGGMQDWNYVWESDFDITLEQNEVKWPNSNLLDELWDDHREPMIAYIEQIHQGLRGIVTDVNSNQPLNAVITIEGIDHDIFTDSQNGDYYRLLTPGQYTVNVSSFGYLPVAQEINIPDNGYLEINFNLTPDPWLEQAEIEDFETEGFNNFEWNLSGNSNWTIDSNTFIEGSHSSKSGNINNNQESVISITLDVVEDGFISFYKKVSCEPTGSQTGNYYDYLSFSINDNEINKWAGDIDWSFESFPVNQGINNFEWKYVKDQGVVSGEDAAWVDFIVFPPLESNSQCATGDLNQDNSINIQDIVLLINLVLNPQGPTQQELCFSDLNQDNVLNVLDVVLLVNLVLN